MSNNSLGKTSSYNHNQGMQKIISECTSSETPVSCQQETQTTFCTGSSKLDNERLEKQSLVFESQFLQEHFFQ